MNGIALMVMATLVLAVQDGLSRYLADKYAVLPVVMIRYWFLALFVVALAIRQSGSLRAAAATPQPWLQALRALLLVGEICVMVTGFVVLGLAPSQAVFACYPLLTAALAAALLGERTSRAQWAAIGLGGVGVLIILRPGSGVFTPAALIPLTSAVMFAAYGVLTRYVGRRDSAATSFFWTGVVGAAAITCAGLPSWQPIARADFLPLAALCGAGALGHFLLIKTYEVAEASQVQPFAYLQLVFAAGIGVAVFGEALHSHVVLGAGVVVLAGLWAWGLARRA